MPAGSDGNALPQLNQSELLQQISALIDGKLSVFKNEMSSELVKGVGSKVDPSTKKHPFSPTPSDCSVFEEDTDSAFDTEKEVEADIRENWKTVLGFDNVNCAKELGKSGAFISKHMVEGFEP